MNDDFTTKVAGSIYTLALNNPELIRIKGSEKLGTFDSLVKKIVFFM